MSNKINIKLINRKNILIIVFFGLILGNLLFQSSLFQSSSQNNVVNRDNPHLNTSNLPKFEGFSSFISEWDTTKLSAGSTTDKQVKLSLVASRLYNFQISWGDGINSTITSYNQAEVTHTFAQGQNNYTMTISGLIRGWQFYNGGDKLKLTEISQWGPLNLGNSGAYFYGASNLNLTAIDAPILSTTTNLSYAFADCIKLGSTGKMNNWNVSTVTDMSYLFYNATSFNQPINDWDTSAVTTLDYMLAFDFVFNNPISQWDVSNVVRINWVFYNAHAFNQSIDTWDTSKVQFMYGTFFAAWGFNQPLNSWNLSSVNWMNYMFGSGPVFNQPLNAWDVSSVHFMSYMFSNAVAFNQPLDSWNVTLVTQMPHMFSNTYAFDQNLKSWNVSNVVDMSYMFDGAKMSIVNYDSLLLHWSKLPIHTYVTFNG